MNANEALDILESAPLGNASSDDALLAEARRLVAADPALEAVAARRRRFDHQIAQSMRDVPVPGEAKARLLARLAQASALHEAPSEPCPPAAGPRTDTAAPEARGAVPADRAPAAPPSASVPGSSRWSARRRLGAAAAAVVCAVALGTAAHLFLAARSAPFALDEVRSAIAAYDPDGPAYRGPIVPRLPTGSGWNTGRIEFEPEPRALPVSSRRRVPAYLFALSVRGRPAVQGYLVAIPANLMTELPPASSFRHENGLYSDGHASVAWTDGDFVFLCVVRGGDDALRLVERALDVRLS